MPLRCCDIRQVRHAEGKTSFAVLERRHEITADPVQPLGHAEALGILPGDLQGLISPINRPHVCLWQRMRQTDRQVATPRPHIQDSETMPEDTLCTTAAPDVCRVQSVIHFPGVG